VCKGFFGRSIFAGFSRSLFAPGLKIRGFHVPSSFGTWIWLQRSVCPILAKLGSCHSTVKKTKEKIVLATPLREVSFSYPPFPHMGNTEIAQKRKERRIKKKKRNYNYFMHVHGHTHPWLKREQMHVCLSSPMQLVTFILQEHGHFITVRCMLLDSSCFVHNSSFPVMHLMPYCAKTGCSHLLIS